MLTKTTIQKFNAKAAKKKRNTDNLAVSFKKWGRAIVQEIAQKEVSYHYNSKNELEYIIVHDSTMTVFQDRLYIEKRFSKLVMKIDELLRQLNDFPFRIVANKSYTDFPNQ